MGGHSPHTHPMLLSLPLLCHWNSCLSSYFRSVSLGPCHLPPVSLEKPPQALPVAVSLPHLHTDLTPSARLPSSVTSRSDGPLLWWAL